MLGNRMEFEIREQPDILVRNSDRYFEETREIFRDRSFEMVLLVARGSSDNAALYARYLIEVYLQIPVVLAAPSVVTRYHRHVQYPNCLAIGISQSGAAPDVAEVLLDVAKSGNLTLGITNTSGSRLTKDTDHSLLLEAGAEKSVAATKTYTSSMLALYQIVRALGGGLPDPKALMPDAEWVETSCQAAVSAQGVVLRSDPIFALSRGFDFCSANESALKLMECALISCKSFSSADFEHGPKALAGHGSCAIAFDGPKPHLKEQGCAIVEPPLLPLWKDPESAAIGPIWNIFFGQWLALVCARARGLNPDDPQFIHKVTQTV